MSRPAVLKLLAELIPPRSRVLDLGCGQGEFLDYLHRHKGCSGYGIEIADHNVLRNIQRGVDVIQLDLEKGLTIFEDQSFDVVLQLDTLQHLRNTETMLLETVRVGRIGIVSFPNFSHWLCRWQLLTGRLPMTEKQPHAWYDTPNIRMSTYADFKSLAHKNDLHILDSFGLEADQMVRFWPGLRASTAVFKLQKTSQID